MTKASDQPNPSQPQPQPAPGSPDPNRPTDPNRPDQPRPGQGDDMNEAARAELDRLKGSA